MLPFRKRDRLPDPELERRPVAAPELPVEAVYRGDGDERGHDVRGVTVERLASSVVAHRCTRVSVAGGFLDD